MDLQISAVRSFVPAKDFDLSKRFYEALGWHREWSDGTLALMETAGQGFYLQNHYVKEWAENTMLHVTVQDAHAAFMRISALLAGGNFADARVNRPKEEPYGALVTYVWDPSGVLLHLAQWPDAERRAEHGI